MTSQTEIDALTTRLMAGRYGELQSLRALAIVEKTAPNLDEQFQRLQSSSRGARPAPSQLQQAGESSTEDDDTPANDQASTVADDLRRLSQSRRVSDLGAFRQRLERVFRSQSQPGGAAPERAPQQAVAIQPTAAAPQLGRPRPRRSPSFPRTPAPAPAPPPAAPRGVEGGWELVGDAADDQGGIVLTFETQLAHENMAAELQQVRVDAVVEQRLRDPRFLAQLERVINSRMSMSMSADETRTGAERVAALRTLLAHRRLQRPAAGAPRPPRQQRAAPRPRGPPREVREVVTMGGAAPGADAAIGSGGSGGGGGGGGGGGATASDVHNLRLVQGASFELLLSIQRTLQQEVAALSAQLLAQNNLQHAHHDRGGGTGGAPATAPPSAHTAPPTAVEEDGAGGSLGDAIPPARLPSALAPHDEGRPGSLGACVVCCEADVNTLFYQCGHLCSCAQCAHMLLSRRAKCPICRAPIRDVVQAFPACAPAGLAAPVRTA